MGRELEAITLHTPDRIAAEGRTSALSENFIPIELAGSAPANRLVRVMVTGLGAEGEVLAIEALPAAVA